MKLATNSASTFYSIQQLAITLKKLFVKLITVS